MTTPLIDARALTKVFPMGGGPVHALRDISVRIDACCTFSLGEGQG